MNVHKNIIVWLFKVAIEAIGSTDSVAIRDALASLVIDEVFKGGRKIVLFYSKIEFAKEHEVGGEKHYRDNIYASAAIAQVKNKNGKLYGRLNFASSKIEDVTLQ